ncbi:MAG: sodium:proton antiporter [Hamadaea sp.]|nr:sodium:proton antiporter [Hamadaea sp.]
MASVYTMIALAGLLILWALVSARAARFSIGVPILLMLAGAVIAGGSRDTAVTGEHATTVRHLLEATLAVILFTDATEVPLHRLRKSGHLPARLLLIAFPLTVAAGFLAGRLLFPAADAWILALVAAALATSDSSLAGALVQDTRIPDRLRTAINVESGLNDGFAAPLVVFFVAGALAGGTVHPTGSVLGNTLTELAVAVPAGAIVGYTAGKLLSITRARGWSTPRSERLAYLSVAALAFATAYVLHGNGLVAAFIAGLSLRAADPQLPEDQTQLCHDVVLLLSAGVWYAFGSTLPDALSGLSWAVVAYALLSLTLVRILPVLLSLVGSDLTGPERLLLGWTGPSGLPSVILGLIALEQLTGDAATLVAALLAATVVLSVLLHGLSAKPVADWLSHHPSRPS